MQDRTHTGSDASHADERALLGERRPSLLRAPHACTLRIPSMQCPREWAGRRAARVDRAAEKEPICVEHVKIMVLEVVFAAGQIGEEAVGVVAVALFNADLRQQGCIHELDVPQVAVQKGEGSDALLVGEHR